MKTPNMNFNVKIPAFRQALIAQIRKLLENHRNLRNHLLKSVKSRERLVVFQSSLIFEI